MASTNFKLFDENKTNMMSDTEYNINTQRLNGVQAGIASSQLQNKTLYQTSLVAYSLAQIMMQNGYDANDSAAVSAFVGNMSNSLLQKVLDKATTAEAQAGSVDNKWMTPAKVKAWWDSLYNTILLPVGNGGTGKSSWYENRLLYASSGSSLSQLNFPFVVGSFLRQGTSGSPYWTKPTDVPSDIGVMGYIIKNCSDASIYGTDVTLTASAVSYKLSNPSELASNGDYSLITLDMSALSSNEALVCLGTVKLFSGTTSTGSYGTTNYWDLSLIVNGVTYPLKRENDGFTAVYVKVNIPALIGRGLVNTDTVQLKAIANGTHSTSGSSGGYVDYVTGVPAVGDQISSDSK